MVGAIGVRDVLHFVLCVLCLGRGYEDFQQSVRQVREGVGDS